MASLGTPSIKIYWPQGFPIKGYAFGILLASLKELNDILFLKSCTITPLLKMWPGINFIQTSSLHAQMIGCSTFGIPDLELQVLMRIKNLFLKLLLIQIKSTVLTFLHLINFFLLQDQQIKMYQSGT